MARRRRPRDQKKHIHEEMLRHLDEHPLPEIPKAELPEDRAGGAAGSGQRTRPEGQVSTGDELAESTRRPRLMLRKLPRELALDSLGRFVRTWRHRGVQEVIVVVGKGRGSPGGIPVLGPAVREWLQEHPEEVLGHEEAPAREGGSGAILVHLRP